MKLKSLLCTFIVLIFFQNCAMLRSQKDQNISEKSPEQIRIDALQAQIDALQTKLNQMESSKEESKPLPAGEPIHASIALSDPQIGFIQNTPILQLRQSKALFDSEKYPESILGFSEFLEKNENHPLASQAQFYLSEAYLRQNDFPVAEKEFRKLLRKYPFSAFATSARSQLRVCEEKLKSSQTAASHRELNAPQKETNNEEPSVPAPLTPSSRPEGMLKTPKVIETSQASTLRKEEMNSLPSLPLAKQRGMSDLDLAPIEDSDSKHSNLMQEDGVL